MKNIYFKYNRFLRYSFFVIFIAIASSNALAQKSFITGKKFSSKTITQKKKPLNYINYIGVTANLSTALYNGDFCDGLECFVPKFSFGLGGEYRYNESLLFRTELNYLRLSSSDAGKRFEKSRGLSFFSNTIDFNVNVVYDIIEFNKMYRRRVFISPYVTVGLGFVTVNPKTKYEGKTYKLRPLQTEGVDYSPISLTIPYGLGFRFNLNPHNMIAFEGNLRHTFTDYLDDVSYRYDAAKVNLPDDDISKILSDRRSEASGNSALSTNVGKRGGEKVKDKYFLASVKFTHTFWVTKQRYNINSNNSKFRLIRSIQKK